MATATFPPTHRVRQIAILVSSVDAAVARQLLLHLPTEMARQVRAMVGQLGTVTPAERRAILNEFQKTASRNALPGNRSVEELSPDTASTRIESRAAVTGMHREVNGDAHAEVEREDHRDMEAEPAPAWTRLSTPALVRFVKGERVAVAAVVISRLPPDKGVEVMRQLPRDVHGEILRRISQLQAVDPSAMTAIEEHLVERLSEYQHLIECEQANLRRLTALLAAAPPELQQEWEQALTAPQPRTQAPVVETNEPLDASIVQSRDSHQDVVDFATTNSPMGQEFVESSAAVLPTEKSSGRKRPLVTATRREMTQATIEELYRESLSSTSVSWISDREEVSVGMAHDEPATLSFAEAVQRREAGRQQSTGGPTSEIDLQPLLRLTPNQLAELLSSMDALDVLLALAGSSPQFMRRFNALLEPKDARVLNERLQKIGTINLREVDRAQRQVLAAASRLIDSVPGATIKAA